MRRRVLISNVREYYDHQRSIGMVWGVVLPSWEELTWDEMIGWEEKFTEQMMKDEGGISH